MKEERKKGKRKKEERGTRKDGVFVLFVCLTVIFLSFFFLHLVDDSIFGAVSLPVLWLRARLYGHGFAGRALAGPSGGRGAKLSIKKSDGCWLDFFQGALLCCNFL